MAQGPCLNPNCSSNGQPHPNCRCYGGMAEGGDIKSHCEQQLKHLEGCEYHMAEGGLVPQDDLPSDSIVPENDLPETSEVPENDLPGGHSEKYGSLGQQALTGVEGIAKGFAGPLATAAELGAHKIGLDKALGIDTSAEAQRGREEENPWTHGIGEGAGLVGGAVTGVGELGLITKALPEMAILGKVGSGIVKGFIENAAIQGGDEVSKALLDQGDPEAPFSSAIAHMGMAGIMGGITGGIFGGVSKGLKAIEDNKISSKLQSFLAGIGDAAKTEEAATKLDPISKFNSSVKKIKELKDLNIPDMDPSAYQLGMQFKEKAGEMIKGKTIGKIANVATTGIGAATGGVGGAVLGEALSEQFIKPYVEKILKKSAIPANKAVRAAMLKILSTGETSGAWNTLKYASDVNKGAQAIANNVDSLFNAGGQQNVNAYFDSEKDREKLRKFVEDGGTDTQIQNEAQGEGIEPEPQALAEGGHVEAKPSKGGMETHLPAQNMMMNTAKGRVYNYLNSIRPMTKPKLAFDTEHKDPVKEHAYNRALDIANKPLSVINHIHDGTITPTHVKHLVQMYPELHSHLSKKITSKIVDQNMEGKKPSYKIRQGLSLLMGTALDSSFTPQAILAAQPKPTQPPAQGQMKGGKATTSAMIKQTSSFQTPNQAAERDKASRD